MSFYDLLESFLRKTLGSMVENELAKEDKYVGMSLDELRALSPGRLIDAAVSRAEYRMQEVRFEWDSPAHVYKIMTYENNPKAELSLGTYR